MLQADSRQRATGGGRQVYDFGSLVLGHICEDREKAALRNTVVEEGPDTCAGGGESFDGGEVGLRQGDPVGEMVLGAEGRGEPITEPPTHCSGVGGESV